LCETSAKPAADTGTGLAAESRKWASGGRAAEGRLAVARVIAADGSAAAGHVAVVVDAAIFDRISTDAAHRRRGLGRAVMGALDAASRTLGARRGLLAATADGYATYRTLGWHVQSPLVSAVIVGA